MECKLIKYHEDEGWLFSIEFDRDIHKKKMSGLVPRVHDTPEGRRAVGQLLVHMGEEIIESAYEPSRLDQIKSKLHQAMEKYSAAHDEENTLKEYNETMLEARRIITQEIFPLLGGEG